MFNTKRRAKKNTAQNDEEPEKKEQEELSPEEDPSVVLALDKARPGSQWDEAKNTTEVPNPIQPNPTLTPQHVHQWPCTGHQRPAGSTGLRVYYFCRRCGARK